MLAWLRRIRAVRADRNMRVEADVADLRARFGERAYYVARDRHREERGRVTIDADRPPGHWAAVKVRIAASTRKDIGIDTATRLLQERRDEPAGNRTPLNRIDEATRASRRGRGTGDGT